MVRDNIRQLIEQAAAQSGAADGRGPDRIAQQTEELERLKKERDAWPRAPDISVGHSGTRVNDDPEQKTGPRFAAGFRFSLRRAE
jgi:hypothetical protein